MIPSDTLGSVELGALPLALEVEFSSVVPLLDTGSKDIVPLTLMIHSCSWILIGEC